MRREEQDVQGRDSTRDARETRSDGTGEPQVVVGGRYRLEHPIGRGGMGTVWAAHDELLNRPVAVKEVTLPHHLGEEQRAEVRERMLREARAAARISSPSAVAVYDVVEDDQRPWIVMQRLAPDTLEDRVREHGPLPPAQVAEIGLAVLDALDAAHASGVLHRDVKPANVLFGGEDGDRAVLGDFGIAHYEGDPGMTSTGVVVGSPSYLAPERARGGAATRASDLWSLGVTLWTALEGHPPFQREGSLSTLTAILTEDVPVAEHARGPLAAVVDGLLQKDPADRMDAATVRRRLRAAAAAAPAAGATSTEPAPTATLPAKRPEPPTAEQPVVAPIPAAATPVPAAAQPPTSPPPSANTTTHSPRRRVAAVAGALVLVALVTTVAIATHSRDTGHTTGASTPRPSATSAPTSPRSSTSSPSASSSSPSTSRTTSSPASALTPYQDRTGFTVGVPAGWKVEHDGQRVRFKDPSSSAYLMVDQTDQPKSDAVADWQNQERSVSRRLPDYQRIAITATSIRGWRGADWEFTWGRGGRTHVMNRALVTGPHHAYALYWSVPAGDWAARQSLLRQITASFQPAA